MAAEPTLANVTFLRVVGGSNLGSWVHRGESAARLVNATTNSCAEAANSSLRADVYVHVKGRCEALLTLQPDATHVIDLIDDTHDPKGMQAGFDAVLMNTDEQLEEECYGPVCAAVPHHYNLPCEPRAQWQPELAITHPVGLLGWSFNVSNLTMTLAGHVTTPLLSEKDAARHGGSPCDFMKRVGSAIAWQKALQDAPVERMANALWLNVPVIAHPHQRAFREYADVGPFLCATGACMNRTLERYARHELDEPYARLRSEVMHDVEPQHVAGLYRRAFEEAAKAKRARAESAVSYSNNDVFTSGQLLQHAAGVLAPAPRERLVLSARAPPQRVILHAT